MILQKYDSGFYICWITLYGIKIILVKMTLQQCDRNGGIMPSTYAHYRIGQEVYGKLEGEPKKIIEKYKELYDIGLHGPDILFYYKPLYEHPVNKT